MSAWSALWWVWAGLAAVFAALTAIFAKVGVEEIDPDLAAFEVDHEATKLERARIRSHRKAWLAEDAEAIAARYRAGELDMFDLLRRYGVIVNWGSGELLEKTTRQFRQMLQRRMVPYWDRDVTEAAPTLKVA